MRKRRDAYNRLMELVFVVMISTMIGMFSGGAAIFTMTEAEKEECKSCNDTNSKDLAEISSVYEEIVNNYYKEVDKKALIEGAIDGMLKKLEDPNSSYLDSSDTKAFDERMTGEYKGVGLEILPDDNGNIMVVNIFEDSPAKKQGIKVGDIVKKVDNIDVVGKTAEEVATAIKTGSEANVQLELLRDNVTIKKTLTKEVIVIKSVTSKVYTRSDKKIGYIKVTVFAGNTYSQFKTTLENLEKQDITSLVIDLRYNTGGYLTAVTDMLELFLEKGSTLYKLQTKNKVTSKTDKTEEKRDYKIVLLVNEYSASASEIMTASLNENINSPIVGANTYGKGTVQQTYNIEDGGMAKITIQKWLTPKDNWIHEVGIKPTKPVVLNENYVYNQTEANDNQLQEALNEAVK